MKHNVVDNRGNGHARNTESEAMRSQSVSEQGAGGAALNTPCSSRLAQHIMQ